MSVDSSYFVYSLTYLKHRFIRKFKGNRRLESEIVEGRGLNDGSFSRRRIIYFAYHFLTWIMSDINDGTRGTS